MDSHTLEIFVSAADLGSFSLAGEKRFLTQPAVSKRIAALEEELGSRLFDRVGRQVRLTEAGRKLLPRARRLLKEMADTRRAISNLSGEVNGLLTMGSSHHIGLHRMPPVLKAFTRRHPDAELDIRFMDSETACRQVEKGTLELAAVTLPPAPLPRLRLTPLWRDPLHFAVARDHPLASATTPSSLESLLAYPAVLPSPNTYTRALLERRLAEQGLELKIGMTTNYLETLKMLATTGLGWALLPETMLTPELAVIRVPDLHLCRQLGLVTHEGHTLSNAARAMFDVCREHAATDPAQSD